MRIAIVGGGASGLVAAYLLGRNHTVHLYERSPNLGGHVRTLGKNVFPDRMPEGKITENGPTGFHTFTSPTFLRLLSELNIPTESVAIGSNLFLRDKGNYFLRPDLQHWRRRFIAPRTGGIGTGISVVRFLVKTRRSRAKGYDRKMLGEVLPRKSYLRDWFRCMAMLSFSTPMELVDAMPASVGVWMLRQGILHADWVIIPGGVYSYQAKILSRFGGKVYLNSRVGKIFRGKNGVELSVNGELTPPYDKLIVATPPGKVLSMLNRPSALEAEFFSAWGSDIPFRTIAHTDLEMYRDRPLVFPTCFDYFQRDRDHFGYNCCVSRLYSGTNEFNFSYNMDDVICPKKQLDTHVHSIPAYSIAALQNRQKLIDSNGDNHTYYSGAYLGCGLHEGAVSSAHRVAVSLGGRSLLGAAP